jgi:hypothetical protein
MRRTIILALLFLSAFAPVVLAQPDAPREGKPLMLRNILGPGIEPGMYTKEMLIKTPVVQKSLKITPAQMEQWTNSLKELKPLVDRIEKWHEYRIKPAEERDPQVEAALREEAAVLQQQCVAKRDQLWAKALDKKQYARLDQVQLQSQGPLAFRRRDIQERLNLSETQIAAILQIVEKGYEEMTKASVAPPEVIPASGEKLTPEQRRAHLETKSVKSVIANRGEAVLQVRTRVMQEAVRQLVRKQRNTFQAMLGEPFDFKERVAEPKQEKQETKRGTEPEVPNHSRAGVN